MVQRNDGHAGAPGGTISVGAVSTLQWHIAVAHCSGTLQWHRPARALHCALRKAGPCWLSFC